MMQAKILEQTGVVEEGARRRETYAEYFERQRVFARPAPIDAFKKPLLDKIESLNAEIRQLEAANRELRRRLSAVREQLDRQGIIPGFVPKQIFSIEAVTTEFLRQLNATERRFEGEFFTAEMIRKSGRRTQFLVIPRHICLWLVRRICVHASTTKIGNEFKMDHTSVMHAIKRAPFWMEQDPSWKELATNVLKAFGC